MDVVKRIWKESARIVCKRKYKSLECLEFAATRFAYEMSNPCVVLISEDDKLIRQIASCNDYGAKSIVISTTATSPADVTLDWHGSLVANPRRELLEAVRCFTGSNGWANNSDVEIEYRRRVPDNYIITRSNAVLERDVQYFCRNQKKLLRLYKQ